MATFFTADTHFGHAKIIVHSKRPFAHVDAMDEAMIARWNTVVGAKDDVWHLGDFNFKSAKPTSYYLGRLNGRVHMVWGNHDDDWAKKAWNSRATAPRFASAQDVKYLRLDGEKLTLYHYAQRVWRNSHHGALHLYGHSHGMLERVPWGKSMDVGVDANDFTPVAWETVRDRLKDRPVTFHHPGMESADNADTT